MVDDVRLPWYCILSIGIPAMVVVTGFMGFAFWHRDLFVSTLIPTLPFLSGGETSRPCANIAATRHHVVRASMSTVRSVILSMVASMVPWSVQTSLRRMIIQAHCHSKPNMARAVLWQTCLSTLHRL